MTGRQLKVMCPGCEKAVPARAREEGGYEILSHPDYDDGTGVDCTAVGTFVGDDALVSDQLDTAAQAA